VNDIWTAFFTGISLFLVPLDAADTITREQGDKILDELRGIRQVLESQQVSPVTVLKRKSGELTKFRVHLDGRYSLGSDAAQLVIIEYSDYQCPFCRRFHLTTFSELKKSYIDAGTLQFFSRDLPLDNHPYAMQAAEAARCAEEQGAFWTMRDRLAEPGTALDTTSLIETARSLLLDVPRFSECLASRRQRSSIESDIREAAEVGANGTPTLLIGRRTPGGIEGELISGAVPYRLLDEKLRSLKTK
jgi:protein-disulfide isomerase